MGRADGVAVCVSCSAVANAFPGNGSVLPIHDLWSLPPGSIQCEREPAAAQSGTAGEKIFVGMPIPAGAMVVAAVIHFESGSPIHELWLSGVWLALLAFTGFLMVSSWRFWSGKELNFAERQPVRGRSAAGSGTGAGACVFQDCADRLRDGLPCERCAGTDSIWMGTQGDALS